MLIIYDSLTGNVERFVKKTELLCTRLNPELKVKEDFVLVSYTIGFGEVPDSTMRFLKHNHSFLKGVAVSGNKNWGNNFGRSGKIISEVYKVPFLLAFELSGTQEDVLVFKREVSKIVDSIVH